MDLGVRSAQFAPFAALTGYEDMVEEEARLTDDEKCMAEEAKLILDCKMRVLQDYIKTKPEITFTLFTHDAKKKGGAYTTIKGRVSKMNGYEKKMELMNGTVIHFGEIVNLEGEILKEL